MRAADARRGFRCPAISLTLEYDGTPFSGWQRQAGVLSVQQVVEEAIEQDHR